MPAIPDPVDVHVGNRVRIRRTLLGLSQGKLAKTLGLSFQQIQKYERGTNRMGASRLHQIGQALDVPVSFFFDGLTERKPSSRPVGAVPVETNELSRRETLELVRAYYRIDDPALRRHLRDLVNSLAGMETHATHPRQTPAGPGADPG